MSYYQTFKKNADEILLNRSSLAKIATGAVLGSVTYWAPPTAAQRLFNKDLTGTAGAAVGIGTGILTAIATGKPEVIVGNLASFLTHLSYVFNDKTVDLLGGYNWRLGKGTAMPTPGTMNDELPDSRMVTLPDGQTATAYNPLSSVPAVQMANLPAPKSNYLDSSGNRLNDYMNNDGQSLNDYMNNDGQSLNDYMNNDGQSLNDYMNNDGQSLNDYMNNDGQSLNDYMNNDGQSLNDELFSELEQISGGF